jgi:hypothetical protein
VKPLCPIYTTETSLSHPCQQAGGGEIVTQSGEALKNVTYIVAYFCAEGGVPNDLIHQDLQEGSKSPLCRMLHCYIACNMGLALQRKDLDAKCYISKLSCVLAETHPLFCNIHVDFSSISLSFIELKMLHGVFQM